MFPVHRLHLVAASAAAIALATGAPAMAEPLAMADPTAYPAPIFQQIMPEPATPYEPVPQAGATESAAMPSRLRRQVVAYATREPAGTIVIDTPNTYLYYVLGGGRAIRYGIGVGREGFTWSGVKAIDRKQEWPDWHPPAEMIARQPYLPRFMAGGPGNPLGARAMYLGGTLYRIHGTSDPSSIGRHVSSGCIRMLNADAIDLYNRAPVGTKVVVLPDNRRRGHEAYARAERAAPARTPAVPPVAAQARAPRPATPVRETGWRLSDEAPSPLVNTMGTRATSLYHGSSASRLY